MATQPALPMRIEPKLPKLLSPKQIETFKVYQEITGHTVEMMLAEALADYIDVVITARLSALNDFPSA